jgi:hypothetical protein
MAFMSLDACLLPSHCCLLSVYTSLRYVHVASADYTDHVYIIFRAILVLGCLFLPHGSSITETEEG